MLENEEAALLLLKQTSEYLRLGRTGRYGAQVQPLQEGSLQVSLEVEEEAHSTPTKEAPKDAPTIQVR
eukprot:s502_g12.t1